VQSLPISNSTRCLLLQQQAGYDASVKLSNQAGMHKDKRIQYKNARGHIHRASRRTNTHWSSVHMIHCTNLPRYLTRSSPVKVPSSSHYTLRQVSAFSGRKSSSSQCGHTQTASTENIPLSCLQRFPHHNMHPNAVTEKIRFKEGQMQLQADLGDKRTPPGPMPPAYFFFLPCLLTGPAPAAWL
jgi:hypothetical protein